MPRLLLRVAVALSALAVFAVGSWWGWREWYSAGHFRKAVAEGIEAGDFSKAERLKSWGADTEKWRKEDSRLQLAEVAYFGNVDSLANLILWGADPDERDSNGLTALMYASVYGQNIMALILLESQAKVDVNAADSEGSTPLHYAAFVPDDELARILLTHGANPHIKNNAGKTPLDYWPELAEIVKQVEAQKRKAGVNLNSPGDSR